MSSDPGSTAELFQLDEATCRSLLTTQHVGRLVVGGDDPAVVAVNYVFVGGVVTFRTEAGTRADQADRQPVLFEVDMFDDRTRSGWSVLVRGRLDAMPLDETSVSVDTWAPGVRDRCITITPDVVTGRVLRGAPETNTHGAGGYL